MATFPRLRTGAIAQYPATRTVEHRTSVLRFVDGGEQRYREYRAPLRRWIIQLSLLDEEEMAELEEFFATHQGRAGSFVFIDPWNGYEHADCSIESDTLDLEFQGEGRGASVLVIRENRT